MRIIKVKITNGLNGIITVSSKDLPNLILAGKNRISILAAIEPAVIAILKQKGEDYSRLRIDAEF